MNIIGIGLSGLVGSRITELLGGQDSFEDLSLETGVNILDFSAVEKRISASTAPWIFHFAAYTDVQQAEKEKERGEESVSWKVNVSATKNICQCARNYNKHVLYLSTDYVFDGKDEAYSEESIANPQGWYAKTKYEGEHAVKELGDLGLVVRIANPYRVKPVGKKDFMHKILERLEQNLPIVAPVNQKMTATYIDDLARAIDLLVINNAHGVYNVPGHDSFSPYEGAVIIAKEFGIDARSVEKTTFEKYFTGRAPIPQYAVLTHDKIEALGVALHTFAQGVAEIKQKEGVQI